MHFPFRSCVRLSKRDLSGVCAASTAQEYLPVPRGASLRWALALGPAPIPEQILGSLRQSERQSHLSDISKTCSPFSPWQ